MNAGGDTIIRDYAALVEWVRQCCIALEITREEVDLSAGLQSGYAGKLLAPIPIKRFGPGTLGPVMMAMGVELVGRWKSESNQIRPRVERSSDARAGVPTPRRPKKRGVWKGNAEWGRILQARRTLMLTPAQRSEAARVAARERWKQVKATQQYVGITGAKPAVK